MIEDIQDLEKEGMVFVISSNQQSVLLHYLNPTTGLIVDEDIKALWHSVDMSHSKRAKYSSSF